jgi:magnesium-transporting ATPase (P-type)
MDSALLLLYRLLPLLFYIPILFIYLFSFFIVAKDASSIVILDDSFASIVKAVMWGRSVFDNIRKFLQFQLTVNVVALTITFVAAIKGKEPPLSAVMMLWVNMIMDTMGALALGTEKPTMKLLDRRPYKLDASLISRPMWRNIICQAIFQLILLFVLMFTGDQKIDGWCAGYNVKSNLLRWDVRSGLNGSYPLSTTNGTLACTHFK